MRSTTAPAGTQGKLSAYLDKAIIESRTPVEKVSAEAVGRGLTTRGETAATQIRSLRGHDPTVLDALADYWIKRTAATATAKGAAAGAAGGYGLPFAVIADVRATVQVTSAVMNAYGMVADTDEGELELWTGLAAAYGADGPTSEGVRSVIVRGVGSKVAVRQVKRTLVPLIMRQQAAQAPARGVPFVSVFTGGALSGASIYRRGRKAKQHFRELAIR